MAAGRLRRAVVLVDGEHYPPVVAAAIADLRADLDVVAGLLIGGTEKLRQEPQAGAYGLARLVTAADADLHGALDGLVRSVRAALVVDLSDEPVVSGRARLRLAATALNAGAAYRAAGLDLAVPLEAGYAGASIAIAGTGKRVGKTAIAGHLARRAAGRLDGGPVVVVAMGRGGPAVPELVDPRTATIGLADLLARARGGAHAASDFLEDAVLAGVPTVGCRRCGGGLAGDVVHSNVAAGAALAASLEPALTIFEGSGASLPPVRCDRLLLVVSTLTPPEEVGGYLGPYRLLRADAVALVGDDEAPGLRRAIAGVRPDLEVIACRLVARPTAPVAGRRVAVFTTAPASALDAIGEVLRERHCADVVAVCGALSDRAALRDALATIDAEVFCTEIKAAAIDVVAEEAARRGVEVVFCDNEPVSAALDGALDRLVDAAIEAKP